MTGIIKKNTSEMLIFISQLVFLYIDITRTTDYSNVLLNRVSFGCIDDCETLQLICSVNDLGLGAFIFHDNKEQAQCVAYLHITCFSVKGNITIISSRDISFTIETRKRGFLNGTWTCRNGAGDDDANSSIEVISTKCESVSIYAKGSKEKNFTKVGLMLIASPLVVFSVTVLSLRCCVIKGQNIKNIQNRPQPLKWLINIRKWLLKKIVCFWKCCIIKEGNTTRSTRTGTEIACQCFYCFILFGMYCIAASIVFLMALGTDLENVFLIFCCLFGIIVACLIPIIWNARIVSTDTKCKIVVDNRIESDNDTENIQPVCTHSSAVSTNSTRQSQRSSKVAGDIVTSDNDTENKQPVCTHSSIVSSDSTRQPQQSIKVAGDIITSDNDTENKQPVCKHSSTVSTATSTQPPIRYVVGAEKITIEPDPGTLQDIRTPLMADEHASSEYDDNSEDEFESVTDGMQLVDSTA